MELSDLILDSKWVINKDILMYNKFVNIPICYFDQGVFYIYLDYKIHNQVLKITKKLILEQKEFYFTSPEYSNPKYDIDNNRIIQHYLSSYIRDGFFYGFSKIGFDLIENMVEWVEKEGCYDLIKENYDILYEEVNKSYYDYYNNKDVYNYVSEIRESYYSLYREIQLNKILKGK